MIFLDFYKSKLVLLIFFVKISTKETRVSEGNKRMSVTTKRLAIQIDSMGTKTIILLAPKLRGSYVARSPEIQNIYHYYHYKNCLNFF